MKIAVLAGGLSPEREVSLSSGSLIANALAERGHSVVLVDVYEGISKLPEDPETLFSSGPVEPYRIRERVPDLEALKRRVGNGKALIGKNVETVCKLADRVFVALHGGMGENGQLQAYLDSCGISYTGSGYDGCLLAMDKELSKRLFAGVGIPTPKWVTYGGDPLEKQDILEKIGLPCVVKPSNGGSSVGVTFAETEEELDEALDIAKKWDSRVLVEEKIVGRELTVGILKGRVLPPVEIIVEDGFYDYVNKYKGTTKEVCPAELPEEILKTLETLTQKGFEVLRLGTYARFDFLLDREGKAWCLEANALPGMTPTSLLPQEAAAVGMDYGTLCEEILKG